MKTFVKKSIYTALDSWYNTVARFQDLQTISVANGNVRHIVDAMFWEYLKKRKSSVGLTLYNVKTGVFYYYNEGHSFSMAGTVKIAILMAVYKQAEMEKRSVTDDEKALLHAMLQKSDLKATTRLWDALGGEAGMNEWFRRFEMKKTKAGENGQWGLSSTTPLDQSILLAHLARKNPLYTHSQQQQMKDVLHEKEGNKTWGMRTTISDVTHYYGQKTTSPRKWNDWRVHETSFIKTNEHAFILTIDTEGNPSPSYGMETIETLTAMLTQYI